MKRLLLLASTIFLFAAVASAQTNKADRAINKANNSVNSATNSVNNASATGTNAVGAAANAATQTKALADQVSNLFGGKKKSESAIVIKVPGADRGKLKQLCAALKECPGVDARGLDYDDGQQTITLDRYKGKLNDLLDDLEKKTPMVTDNNVHTSKSDNTITINL